MKIILNAFSSFSLILLIGIILFVWGTNDSEALKIIGGLAIVFFSLKLMINNFFHENDIKKELEKIEDEVVLFYAGKKNFQSYIEKELIPHIPKYIKVIYYDGPTLIGPIDSVSIKRIIDNHPSISVKSPSIFKIKKNNLSIDYLDDEDLREERLDIKRILSKIESIKNHNYLENKSL